MLPQPPSASARLLANRSRPPADALDLGKAPQETGRHAGVLSIRACDKLDLFGHILRSHAQVGHGLGLFGSAFGRLFHL